MPFFAFRHPRTRRARWIAVALALLTTMQAFASSALATLGPLHTHRGAPTVPLLEDVRRGPAHGIGATAAALERHGHAHAGLVAARHHHAPGDGSVALADGDGALHGGDVDDAAGTALGALIGLVLSVVAWLPHGVGNVESARAAWVPHLHQPDLPERPPRIG